MTVIAIFGLVLPTASTRAENEPEEADWKLGVLIAQYEKERNQGLTKLNERYIQKIKLRKKEALRDGDLAAANECDRQIKKLAGEIEEIGAGAKAAPLMASLAGDWHITTSKWRFTIHPDGVVTSTHNSISEERRGRMEVIDLEHRLVRLHLLRDAAGRTHGESRLWKVSPDSKSMSGSGVEGGSKLPAKRR